MSRKIGKKMEKEDKVTQKKVSQKKNQSSAQECLNGGGELGRGGERTSLGGEYLTPGGQKAALDWEQPISNTFLNSHINGYVGVIPCFVCGLTNKGHEKNRRLAWVLLKCKSCEKRWFCLSRRQEGRASQVFSQSLVDLRLGQGLSRI